MRRTSSRRSCAPIPCWCKDPLPTASAAFGVGHILAHDAGTSSSVPISLGMIPDASSTACSSDGAEWLSIRVAADLLVRVAETRGVGHIALRAICPNDIRTAAPSDGDWFDP
jgi:hypothetical protein